MCVCFMFLKKKSTLCSLHPYYVTEKSQLNQWLSTKLNKEEKKMAILVYLAGLASPLGSATRKCSFSCNFV